MTSFFCSIHNKYFHIKTALSHPHVRDPALKLISDKLPEKLQKLTRFMSVVRGDVVVGGGNDESSDDHERHGRVRRYSIGERRKQIREMAFERGAQTERNKHLLTVTKHLKLLSPQL
jgi:hypothetical protein